MLYNQVEGVDIPDSLLEPADHDHWKVLIVDIEESIHSIAEVALAEFEYENRGVSILNARTVSEAKKILRANRDIAVAFIHVEMEAEKSGFDVIKYVREQLRNRLTRIVLRTNGALGEPALDIIKSFDINDIREKNELESNKIITLMISSLRSYQDMILLETNRIGLNRILFFSIFMLQQKDIRVFLRQACQELSYLALDPFGQSRFNIDSFFIIKDFDSGKMQFVAQNSDINFEEEVEQLKPIFSRIFEKFEIYQREGLYLFPYKTKNSVFVMYFRTDEPLDRVRVDLLNMYFSVVSASLSNLELQQEIFEINKNLELKVESQVSQLKSQNVELSQLFESKKNLLRIMYHDLNNTLGVMMAASEIAESLKENQWQKNTSLWQKVKRSLNIQKEIIEQVKNMDAVRTGKENIQLSDVNLSEIIEQAAFIFREKFAQKSIDFQVISDCKEEILVRAEPVSLSNSVFNNFISNSIKFTLPNGYIKVQISSNLEEKPGFVEVAFTDNGVGMPPHILEHIFREDYKTTRVGTSGEKGTGFGMPLVKTYIEKFGGSITVESKSIDDNSNDHGTTFRVYLRKSNANSQH